MLVPIIVLKPSLIYQSYYSPYPVIPNSVFIVHNIPIAYPNSFMIINPIHHIGSTIKYTPRLVLKSMTIVPVID